MAKKLSTDRPESVRRRTRPALSDSPAELAEASIACTFGHLLDKIWNFAGEMGELNGIATVLQRLIASYQQLDELRRRPDIRGQSSTTGEGGDISEAALLRMEERLRLL